MEEVNSAIQRHLGKLQMTVKTQTGCGDDSNSLGRLKLSRDCTCRVTEKHKSRQRKTEETKMTEDVMPLLPLRSALNSVVL